MTSNEFKSKINFSDGIPERISVTERPRSLIELLDKTCNGCMRFTECKLPYGLSSYRCSCKPYARDITPDHMACEWYWDKAEQEKLNQAANEAVEKRRKELWAIYAELEPVQLPIVSDGYGTIPMCPICGEIPQSTEQCYWCGQRFLQDDAVRAYNEPEIIEMTCPLCGGKGKATVSKYNGHKHFLCSDCHCKVIE